MTNPERTSNAMSALAAALWTGAVLAVWLLWPKGDPGEAVVAGGVLATAGSVLWVGAALLRRG